MNSLIDEIVHSVVTPAIEKRFFSKPSVAFQRYLGCYQEAFEIGVVLGYGFRDKLSTFAMLFTEPGHEQGLISFMQELAQERLMEIAGAETFFPLAMFAEEKRITKNWRESAISETQIEQLKRNEKIPFDNVFKNLYVAVSTGIGFGSAFPELTEQMWQAEHEGKIAEAEWIRWKKSGLDIPDEPEEPVTLALRQEQLLSQVELFVSRVRPELLPEFEIKQGRARGQTSS